MPTASGVQDGIAPNLSGLRRYSPICPRQMHGTIPPLFSCSTNYIVAVVIVLIFSILHFYLLQKLY